MLLKANGVNIKSEVDVQQNVVQVLCPGESLQLCNNPAPAHEGSDCEEDAVETRCCKDDPCPGCTPRVTRSVYNLEPVPLEIMADAELGDGEVYEIRLLRGDPSTISQWEGEAGGLEFKFASNLMKYHLRW